MTLALLIAPLLLQQPTPQLQIKDTSPGEGLAVQVGDRLTVHYTGKLVDGKQFDSSVGKDPFSFIVGAGMVIQGWDQGLIGMKPSGKRTLTIPPTLGYGDKALDDIPANSTLLFDVELLKVERVPSKITAKGTGEPVKGRDTVLIHYKGKFTDGKPFDSSYDRGDPFEITLGVTGLIPGFTMGVLGMRVGEKRTITIPPSLAYGEKGAGDIIPPNSTLVFDLELVKKVEK